MEPCLVERRVFLVGVADEDGLSVNVAEVVEEVPRRVERRVFLLGDDEGEDDLSVEDVVGDGRAVVEARESSFELV